MKLTIERSAFLRALGHVQNVVERRNTIPILSNVQLVADEAGLSLTATDLDLAIVETVACEVQQPGGTTVVESIWMTSAGPEIRLPQTNCSLW